ncbi:MAG TPA: restriction endonuclease subunit S [Pseudomonas sp.]|nr:restriction endonuclease subunit S [Pseudomonas sp.]
MSSEAIVGRFSISNLIKAGVITAHKDGNFGSLYPRIDDFVEDGIPLLTAKFVSDGRIDFDAAQKLSQDKAVKLPYGFIQTGDVLLSHNATVGRVAVVPELNGQAMIGTSLTYFRLDSSRLLPRYLACFFESRDFQNQLSSVMGLSTRNQVPITAQRLLEVEVPPLAVQRQLSEFVGAIDDRITLLRETNATLEAIAQALFKSWFVDFDPVHAKAEGRQPEGMDAATADLFPDSFEETELGLVPKGWQRLAFTETVKLIGGGTPKTSVPEYWDGDIPWFSVVDAPAVTDVFVIDTLKHISLAGLNGSSTKLLSEGTTIISARGTVGRLALVGKDMAMNQSCYGLQGKARDAYFTYFSTYRLVEALKQRSHGSVFDTITSETMKGVQVIYPSTNVIEAFEAVLRPFMLRIKENLQQSQTLTKLRDTLLPRLISGQLRLPEAVAEVEDTLV